MKKIIFFIAVLITTLSVAQTVNETINYKAIIKDNLGNVVANNNNVLVQFKILQGVAQTNVYEEIHSANTDANGFLIVQIGDGTVLSQSLDAFINIDWSSHDHFLNVQIDTGSGIVDLGTTAFKTVPFAFHATTALNAGATSINGLSDGKSDDDGSNNGSSLFLGIDAGLNDNGTSNVNVGVGFNALKENTTGSANTATGFRALSSNTTGENNTANGTASLSLNTTGDFNTANGNAALGLNTTGNRNTANGQLALFFNETGNDNTANGFNALLNNTIGEKNTANGAAALHENTTGKENTANGYEALYSNSTGDASTANGYQALRSNITGVNNTANGYQALRTNTTGNWNTANGYQALYSNISAYGNTANGRQALYTNSTGYQNTANGHRALYSNSIGFDNTANGNGALSSNTTGSLNTANGHGALKFNTTGSNNTANGIETLNSNITGSGNVALGFKAGYNETGSNKLYISNTDTNTPLIYGEFNTKKLILDGATTVNSPINANPDLVLGGNSSSTSGDDGIIASDPAYAGSDIFIRSNDAVVVQLDFDNNEAGDFEIRNGTQTVVFEVNESGTVRVNNVVQHSDRRLKKDIETLPYGLKEILQLQPKTYNWKDRTQAHKSLGLIAQEVQPLIKEIVVEQDNEQKTLGVNYTELIPVLINAIQEQQELIEALKTKNNNQDNVLAQVLKRLNTLEDSGQSNTKKENDLFQATINN